MTIIAVLVGCGFTVLAAGWIAAGRIEYWTGQTERHHFVVSRDYNPASYWLLTSICSIGALVFWYKLLVDLLKWLCAGVKKATDLD